MTPVILDPILTGGPTPEMESGWEEVYGDDQPLSPGDVPVIQNSLCRVRFDATNTPGFRVDAWNAVSSLWVEQGKVIVFGGSAANPSGTLVSAAVPEWTPERAAVLAVLTDPTDAASRERVLITLQRGWSGPRFEVYTPVATDYAFLRFVLPAVDVTDAAFKIDAGNAGVIAATAGSPFWPFGNLGASSFTGENELAVIRQGGDHQLNMAVLQATAIAQLGGEFYAYGAERNCVQVAAAGNGYVTARLGFCPQASDQINEAEAIRYTSSGTTSQITDATASGGLAVKDTQVAATNATLNKPSTTLAQAKYRAFLRVRVDSGATGSFIAYIGTGASNVVTSTATAWTWIDLGDVLASSAGTDFQVNAWRSGGSGAVYVDQVALVKLEDRTSPTIPAYDGARDLGQMTLMDSRVDLRRISRG